jgi:hypothetical protein
MNTTKESLFIATPAFGGNFCGSYVTALVDTLAELAKQGVEASFAWSHSSIVGAGRDLLVARFLASRASHLVFVDADQGLWSAADILAMVRSGFPVCGAIVPMKTIDWGSVAAAARRGTPPEKLATAGAVRAGVVFASPNPVIVEGRPFAECESVGTGLMTIERSVFEKLAPHAQEYTTSAPKAGQPPARHYFPVVVEGGRLRGEDEGFCRMWKSVGGRIGCLLDARVSHVGTYAFPPMDPRTLYER